jgi:hypothetical protein
VAESFFSKDYSVARERFRESAASAGARLDTLNLTAKGPAGESLGIDIAWLGARHPRRVFIHSAFMASKALRAPLFNFKH